jgi:hypothetical protein
MFVIFMFLIFIELFNTPNILSDVCVCVFAVKCSCICFIFVLRVAYVLGRCVDCKSVTYVELPSYCISECFAAFSFVLSFYFI